MNAKIRLAIFASGTGSNAERICAYFDEHPLIEVALIVTNKRNAGVLQLARSYEVATMVFDRRFFYETTHLLDVLRAEKIQFIALAGFLWLIPDYLIQAFPNALFNIHPALLPAYGGKGMYGMNVHRAVKQAGESKSGMTIHLVDGEYDNGRIIFQAEVALSSDDTAEQIAAKVLELEHVHYAPVIEQFILHKVK